MAPRSIQTEKIAYRTGRGLNRVQSDMRNFHFVFSVGDVVDFSGDAV